jgi:hypothetical protein
VLRISKRPEPVNLVHCPSCDRHEPLCYSRRHRPTPRKHLEGQPRVCGRTQNTDSWNPGCAVGPKTPGVRLEKNHLNENPADGGTGAGTFDDITWPESGIRSSLSRETRSRR